MPLTGRANRRRLAGARGKGRELLGRGRDGERCRRPATAFGVALEPRDLALLCQRSENLVAGAPCGVMDQMTCVFGERDALLALLCQPAELQPSVPVPETSSSGGSIPASVTRWADPTTAPSGRAHSWGCESLATHAGVPVDYLANIAPSEFERELAALSA